MRQIAESLRDRGYKVWLDEWELVPGRPWQEAIEEIIASVRSSAVLVGKDGLGPWEIVVRIRRRAGFLGKVLDCFYCLSVWIAFPFALILGDSWRHARGDPNG